MGGGGEGRGGGDGAGPGRGARPSRRERKNPREKTPPGRRPAPQHPSTLRDEEHDEEARRVGEAEPPLSAKHHPLHRRPRKAEVAEGQRQRR